MTYSQILAFAVVAGMMALFVWGRFRYDVVAAASLLVSVLVGIVPANKAFSGFSDDIVIIVASALLVSAAVARSGVLEAGLNRIAPYLRTTQIQVVALVAIVTLLSSFVKNIGALAMMIPVAFQIARRAGTPPSSFLMPMAFGSLLGGIVTLVGTSPNIIVSRVRQEILGEPFQMFDFTPVGAGIALAGVIFLAFGYRLLPKGRKGTVSLDEALNITDYVTEARVRPESEAVGLTVADLHQMANGEVKVAAIIRNETRSSSPLPDAAIRENDVLLLEGEPDALESLVARAGLKLSHEHRRPETDEATDEIGVIEAIVGPNSVLTGVSAERIALYRRFQVNLLAVSRSGVRFNERLRSITLRPGDVLVLQGNLKRLPDTLKDLGCLPLAEREIRLGNARRSFLPLAILAGAMALVAVDVLPVAIAFFGAAVLLVLFGSITLREAYETIEWPIIVMLGALIPVSEAIRTTGGTDLIAAWLSSVAQMLPPTGALVLIMVAAMAVTPFLNNAATVLVMAPIAASFANQLGFRPDAFLMAVAIGAACDFLTPIGHQCNTLVMGPGGYRFGDYWRLGLPLSAIVIVVGIPLIMLFWPLR
ncbi:SLC13 family permease [Microvirga thermotolerans]|uniref:TRAP transporter large permease subunit n=1 Tax=Microvirga thermotolerans TaxID=2651334 RepID=A0A5P9JT08_9HYPH|nr:SLC13 family permease [Microvirga thermotolerans]QFU15241.1 TRAP transporter large permease subunit [Microvirga thermotolerans]